MTLFQVVPQVPWIVLSGSKTCVTRMSADWDRAGTGVDREVGASLVAEDEHVPLPGS